MPYYFIIQYFEMVFKYRANITFNFCYIRNKYLHCTCIYVENFQMSSIYIERYCGCIYKYGHRYFYILFQIVGRDNVSFLSLHACICKQFIRLGGLIVIILVDYIIVITQAECWHFVWFLWDWSACLSTITLVLLRVRCCA